MLTLRDATLNEIYCHVMHDRDLAPGLRKKWGDRLAAIDEREQHDLAKATPVPPPRQVEDPKYGKQTGAQHTPNGRGGRR